MIKIALVAGALVSGFALSASAAPMFIGKASDAQASSSIEQAREGAASHRQRGGKRGGASLEQKDQQQEGGIVLVREGGVRGKGRIGR